MLILGGLLGATPKLVGVRSRVWIASCKESDGFQAHFVIFGEQTRILLLEGVKPVPDLPLDLRLPRSALMIEPSTPLGVVLLHVLPSKFRAGRCVCEVVVDADLDVVLRRRIKLGGREC